MTCQVRKAVGVEKEQGPEAEGSVQTESLTHSKEDRAFGANEDYRRRRVLESSKKLKGGKKASGSSSCVSVQEERS